MDVVRFATWLLPLAVAGAVAPGGEVERLVISQVNPQLPVMTAYLDILDGSGHPVAGLSPANFSATLGTTPLKVSATEPFEGTGEGVAYVFLVDISKSISQQEFNQMRAALHKWIEGLTPRDKAAICTLGEDYQIVEDFTSDKQKLAAALNGVAPRDQHTRLYLALDRMMELARRVDPSLPARRVAVLMSDGKDEGSAITPEDILPNVRTNHIAIYSIGYSRLPRAEKRRYLDVLARFSDRSGGLYKEASSESIDALYAAIQQAILRVFVVRLSCPNCPADGRHYPLQITVTQVGRGISDTLSVMPYGAAVPVPPPVPVIPWWRNLPVWFFVLAGVAVVAAVAFALLRRKRAQSGDAAGSLSLAAVTSDSGSSSTDSPPAVELQGGIPLRLTVVIGKEAGRSFSFRLSPKAVIGRSKDCDVVLSDPKVSNRHCEMALVNRQVLVYDLDSTNTTRVNGVPIRGRQKLEDGDSIQLGDTELRLHIEAA